MKKFNYRQAAFTAAVTAATFVPSASIAHADDYDYSATSTTAGAGLGFGLLAFFIATAVVSLALFVLWVVMLVDALQRKTGKMTIKRIFGLSCWSYRSLCHYGGLWPSCTTL